MRDVNNLGILSRQTLFAPFMHENKPNCKKDNCFFGHYFNASLILFLHLDSFSLFPCGVQQIVREFNTENRQFLPFCLNPGWSIPFSAARAVHTHACSSSVWLRRQCAHRPSHLDLCLILRQATDRKHLSSWNPERERASERAAAGGGGGRRERFFTARREEKH